MYFKVNSLAMGCKIPDSKVHGANMGPTSVLSAPDGAHVGPINLAIRDAPIVNEATLKKEYY